MTEGSFLDLVYSWKLVTAIAAVAVSHDGRDNETANYWASVLWPIDGCSRRCYRCSFVAGQCHAIRYYVMGYESLRSLRSMAMCDDDEGSEYTSGFDVKALCHRKRAGVNGVEWVC